MSTRKTAVEPIAAKISTVADMLGVSPSTIRRLVANDPEFPRPFKLAEKTDLLWSLAEVRTYLMRKSGRAF